MKRKLAVICMALTLLLSPLSACKPSGDVVPNPPQTQKEKPILLFEIDEGVKNLEMLGVYANDFQGLRGALDNISRAVLPLREKYDVRYLAYCHYQYSEKGFGKGNRALPENRIAPVLKECLRYLEEKGEKIYLEEYSSGVYSHQIEKQDGSVSVITPSIPAVPVHYGEEEKVYGISMDMEAIEYLAEEYSSFVGVRFHELVGSNGAYAQKVSTRAIQEIVDVCKRNDLELVWGDHSWDSAYLSPTVEEWRARIRYAADTLGEKCTINFSNNSWDLVKSVSMRPMLREEDYKGASFGYSVQAWFWQENDAASLNTEKKPKWYTAAYQDMPVELMAAFTRKGIALGARIIQYEPTNYFFNYYVTGNLLRDDNFTENGADYTGRITLARMIDLLTEENELFSNPAAFYSTSESSLDYNREEDAPFKYAQTTLFAVGEDVAGFDAYNVDSSKMVRADKNRLLPAVTQGELFGISRISLTFGCRDEFLVVRNNDGKLVADFYYYNSCKIRSDDRLFAENERGKVVSFSTANVYSEKVASLEGDPDEIILLREKDGAYTYEVYAASSENGGLWNFEFRKREERALSSQTRALGYRTRKALKTDETRTLDSLLQITQTGNCLQCEIIIDDGEIEANVRCEIDLEYELVDYTLADVDLDVEDELVLLLKRPNGEMMLQPYRRLGDRFEKMEELQLELGSMQISKCFSLRTTTYYNKALLY